VYQYKIKILEVQKTAEKGNDRIALNLTYTNQPTLSVNIMSVKQNLVSTANLLWELGSIPQQFDHHENKDQKKMIGIAQNLLSNFEAILQGQGDSEYENVIVPNSIITDFLDETPSRNPSLYLERILKDCDVEDKKARGTSEALNLFATKIDLDR
jgi:hypothetical protein